VTSRERVLRALSHQEPDRVPVDLGSCGVTGIMVSAYAQLRRGLGVNGAPPRVSDLIQMLGEVEIAVLEKLGCDVIGLMPLTRTFGITYANWKAWRLPDGTEACVPGQFNYLADNNGDLLLSPRGDTSKPPSGRMPKNGYYFDLIPRQQPIDWDRLNPDEFAEQFKPLPDSELAYLQETADRLHRNTDFAILGSFGERGLGNLPLVLAPEVDGPKGIRNFDDWLVAHITHPWYVKDINARHAARIIENLELFRQAVGDRVVAVYLSGTDFGTQRGEFFSPDIYRELYLPYHKQINDWVHANTEWQTFFHSCGSIYRLIPSFIEAGVDILNPVQCSAANMEAERLKREFGDRLAFWGGGVDTQKTLPFGTPEEVRGEVAERIRTFAPGGGYVFNPIHNIQAKAPVENVLAMFEAVRDAGRYPIHVSS